MSGENSERKGAAAMDFAEWIREQATKTYTENGAAARNTTGDARLDLFATIGSLRLSLIHI